MVHYDSMPMANLPGDRALVVFGISTPVDTATVHLVGSWDNFSAPLLMARDAKATCGSWKVCLGSSKYGAGASVRGLKMGGHYTYYFVINGHIQMPDPTVSERVVDPRSGTICSVIDVPFQVAAGEKVIAGSPDLATTESFARELSVCQSRRRHRPTPLDLNQNSEGYMNFEKPVPSPLRANAPRRPTVVIPTGPSKDNYSSPISTVPSLTPSSGLNSAMSPGSVNTPYSGKSGLRSKRSFGFGFGRSNSVREIGERADSPPESGKRRGFHLKTPSIPALSNLISGSSSKSRTGFPVISNPILQEYEKAYYGPIQYHSSSRCEYKAQATGLGISLTSCESSCSSLIEDEEQEILEAQGQAYDALRSRLMTQPVARPLSVASTTISDSPSLTQSEFSIESSPSPIDDTSSISSSPMQSSFDSDIEIETDDEDEALVAAMLASKLHISGKHDSLEAVRAGNLSDMENWYRNAVKISKSRSSRYSRSTRFSDVSCITKFEDSSQDGHHSQISLVKNRWPKSTDNRPHRLSPNLLVHAPMPVRPEAEAVVAIESMEAQAEARLRSLIRSSWGRFDSRDIDAGCVDGEYRDYLEELSYLRQEVEDLRREKEYLRQSLEYSTGYYYE
ncbi:hypothetical protein H072_5718 [Dactylellina haptotyla CBS 200.50]|uniref:Uncharacterized protein n=1 Tax=Dactylellina haptotyla (strain CBS 200.50) TaxID=1284197 RepID=S8BYK9_DACHA|nr:hypothetical protein H072_5718 [Dactylellina haptotyla CBS 200.50]